MKNQKGFTLIELLVVMGILAILLAAVLVAINPQRQFAQGRDSQRRNDVLALLNSVQQNMADNKGTFSVTIPSTATEIKKTAGVDLCSAVMPSYISALPVDPNSGAAVTDCTGDYVTGYSISKDSSGRITVKATPEVASVISVTR